MIIHECENGQKVAYSNAEKSEVKDGFVHFYDVHGELVGLQPAPAAPEPEPAPTEPPKEPPKPPSAPAAAQKEPDHDAT